MKKVKKRNKENGIYKLLLFDYKIIYYIYNIYLMTLKF